MAVSARARRVEIAPSEKEVEEHTLDRGVFRSWCPGCVKGRAEARGHVREVAVGVGYAYTRSEREREEELGAPIVVVKDSKTKMIMAKVVPSKEVEK